MFTMKCVLLVSLCVVGALAHQEQSNSGFRMIRKIYNYCENSEEIFRCLKEQAVKITDRAIKLQNIPVVDGITVIRRKDIDDARAFNSVVLTDDQIKTMTSQDLDEALAEKTARFLDTHEVSMSVANMLGQSGDGESISRMIEEGRGKLKKYIGPILTAIAIKGGFVAMAFQAIAMIAGKALLIGKIALVLSAIIGLKKLVSGGEAHEKTTYEIVKHPQVSQSHTYSSSHFGGGDYETSGAGGHYRRSLEDNMVAQERAFRAQVPRS